jgi:hypothetical protein
MKTQWFKRLGWLYLPISLPGGIVTLAALAFCVQVFFAIDRKSYSVSDTLYGVFPFFACAFLLCSTGSPEGPATSRSKPKAGVHERNNFHPIGIHYANRY